MAQHFTRPQTARLSSGSGSGEPPKRKVVGTRRRPTGPNTPQTGGTRPEAPTRDDRQPSRAPAPTPTRDKDSQ